MISFIHSTTILVSDQERALDFYFSGPPEPMPWGDKAMWMLDPDGNRFFLTGR